jgi:hypothetical protein
MARQSGSELEVISHKRKQPVLRLRHGKLVGVRGTGDEIVGERRQPSDARIVERNGRLVRIATPAVPVSEEATPVEPSIIGVPTGKVEARLITAFVISLLLPFSWNLGPLRLPPYLGLLAIGFLPLLLAWLRQRYTRIIVPDILMLFFCIWSVAALFISSGVSEAIQPAGVQFLATFGTYLAGRLLVRDAASMRVMVRVAVIAFVCILPAILAESLTGQKPLLRLASLFGQAVPDVHMDKRLGLTRAQGPFEHPILMGVFAASLLSTSFYTFREKRYGALRWIAAPAAAVCCLLTLSTGALVSFNLQILLMLWSRVFRGVEGRWRILIWGAVAVYVAIDMGSTKTPFHVFVNYATFSSGSSYNRILIWQFGSAEALRHPLFGIGMGDWLRPSYMGDSMDNFWLVQAVRYGIPAFAMLAGSVLSIIIYMGRVAYETQELILMRRGAILSIVGSMVAIVSVHLWNASYVWFILLFSASAWMALPGFKPRPVRTNIVAKR